MLSFYMDVNKENPYPIIKHSYDRFINLYEFSFFYEPSIEVKCRFYKRSSIHLKEISECSGCCETKYYKTCPDASEIYKIIKDKDYFNDVDRFCISGDLKTIDQNDLFGGKKITIYLKRIKIYRD